MRKRRSIPRPNGFTLVELLVTTTMSLVVAGSLFGAMIAQQRSYAFQLESSDASQGARAALSILKAELRMAGWGLQGLRDSPLPPVGSCNTPLPNQFQCNNQVDIGGDSSTLSDRLRVVSMVPSRFDDNTDWGAGNVPQTHNQAEFLPSEDVPPGIQDDALALLDGSCAAPTTDPVVQLAEIVSDSGSSGGFWHNYNLSDADSEYPGRTCTTYNAGFRMGMARVVDFYIDRTLVERGETVPRLMMHVNPNSSDVEGNPTVADVVAYNIDSLQVEYLIDSGTDASDPAPDQLYEVICNDLTDCDTEVSVVSTTTFTASELAARTVALRIGIVPRAESPTYSQSSSPPAFGTVFDRDYDTGDKYRRWVFRSTVRLRNNEIQ